MLRRGPDPVVTRRGATAFGVLIAIGAIVLAVPLLPGESAPREGDIAPRAFAAVRESEYVSAELTETAREEAAAAVEPVMASLEQVPVEQLKLLNTLFEEVARLRLRTGLSSEEQLGVLGESPAGIGLGQAIRSTLLTLEVRDLESLRAAAVEGVSAILSSPLQEEDKRNRIEAYLLVGNVPSFQNGEGALRELLDAFVSPTVAPDAETTQALREEARESVEPVLVTYATGEVIAKEGQTLDAVVIEALRETGVIREGFDYYDLGAGLLMGAALGAVLGVYLYRLQPFSRPAERRALMTLLAVLGTLAAVRLGLPELLPDTEGRFFAYAMPVAAAAVVVTSVSAPRFGAIVAVVVALYAGFIAATAPALAGAAFTSALEPLQLVIAYAAGGLAGAAAMQRTERLGRFAGRRRRGRGGHGGGAALVLAADGAARVGGPGLADAGGHDSWRRGRGDRPGPARAALDGAARDDTDAADGAGAGGTSPATRAAGEGSGHVPPQHVGGDAGGAGGKPHRGGLAAGAGGGVLPRHRQDAAAGVLRGEQHRAWPKPSRQPPPGGERHDHPRARAGRDGPGPQAAAAGNRGGTSSRSTTERGSWSSSTTRRWSEAQPTPRGSATPGHGRRRRSTRS